MATKVENGRKNDPQRTQENILEVATEEFSTHGLAGGRVDAIAERTRTSKRMIYYYFGGKEELYRAVLERSYSSIRAREAEADFESQSADQALRSQIEHTFDYHVEHPEFVRLVMNENIHHGAHIGHVDGLMERNKSVIASLKAIIDKGVEAGIFRSGIDPVELHMSISALCFYNVSNRYTFASNFGVDMASAETLAKRRVQVADIILAWAMH